MDNVPQPEIRSNTQVPFDRPLNQPGQPVGPTKQTTPMLGAERPMGDVIQGVIAKLMQPFEGKGHLGGLVQLAAQRGTEGVRNAWNDRITTYTKDNPLDAVISQYKQPIGPEQPTMAASAIQSKPQPVISAGNPFEDMVFHESFEGNRGVPQFKINGEWKYLDEIDFKPEPKQRITKLEIKDQRPGHSITITDPKQLEVANTIKAVADAVAPEYTDYLLRLGWYEGRYDPKQRNDNGDSIDKGIFQINDKYMPDVPESIADDPARATLWAISLIESGKQTRWVADPYVKKAKTNISYE